jgi:hypothetical protein
MRIAIFAIALAACSGAPVNPEALVPGQVVEVPALEAGFYSCRDDVTELARRSRLGDVEVRCRMDGGK